MSNWTEVRVTVTTSGVYLSLSLSSCSGYFWSWSQRPSKRIFWSCGSLFILESLRCSASSAHATWYWYDSRVIGYRIVEVFVLILCSLSYLLREKRKKLPTYPMGIERKLPPACTLFKNPPWLKISFFFFSSFWVLSFTFLLSSSVTSDELVVHSGARDFMGLSIRVP